MAKKRKAKKSKPKRTAQKNKPRKSKSKTLPKKPPTSNLDAPTPVGPSVASDEALEDAATGSKFTGLCA